MVSFTRILFLSVLAWLPQAWAQCTSEKLSTFLVSDRYRDAAEYGNHLILANAHGLIFRNLNDLATVAHIEPLGGDVVEVHVRDNLVFATARDTGLYIFEYKNEEEPPVLALFQPIEELKSISIGGEAIFANLGEQINYYRFNASGRLTLVSRLVLASVKLLATESILFVQRRSDSGISVYPFVETGFRNNISNLTIDGDTNFYDMALTGDSLVVDGLNAVSWADFSPDGNLLGQGTYFRNDGTDLVFAYAVSDDHLFLRFAERLDVYRIGANHSLSLLGRVDQIFSEIGITRMVPTAERLHVLNFGRQGREWSLNTYSLGAAAVAEQVRLDANFEEISAAANAGPFFYLGSQSELFHVSDEAQLSNISDLTPIATFDGAILEMTGSDNLLYVATLVPDTAFTRLQVLAVEAGGALEPLYSEDFQGTISELRHYGNRLSFVQFFNTTSEARYQAHLLRRVGDTFDRSSLVQDVAIQAPSPFADLQYSEVGLVFHTGNQIFVYPDGDNLADVYSAIFVPDSGDPNLVRLFSQDGFLWAEFTDGLVLLQPNNRAFEQVGFYTHWNELTLLPSNQLLASNKVDPGPGRFHLLRTDRDDPNSLVYSSFSFSAPTLPIFLTAFGEELLIADKSSINLYEMTCPGFDYLYLLPLLPGLEMEINSDLLETDAVVLSIYNYENELIGSQTLTRQLIGKLNRKPVHQWFFDVNTLEEIHSFLLRSSKPLYPVLSGYAGKENQSRFAFTMPPYSGSKLYLPHIPADESSWVTDAVLRNWHTASEPPAATITPAVGDPHTEMLSPNGSDFFRINGRGWGKWAEVQAASLDTHLSGFALYRLPGLGQAAALPLNNKLQEFFLVPYLAGRGQSRGWTGLVLSNPHVADDNIVRIVGYDLSGAIVADRTIQLEAQQRLVQTAESWLEGNLSDNPVQWLAVIAELPIMGAVLYGDSSTTQLAGLPLYPDTSEQLTFVGVRANAQWWTDLVITNTDPEGSQISYEALDGAGNVLAVVNGEILPNQSLRLEVDALFGALAVPDLDGVQTVRVKCQAMICGTLLRGLRGVSSLEACSPGYGL